MSQSAATNIPSRTSIADQIEARQASLGITNQDLCTALGFEREIALTLIKAGNMRMPLTKIPALASALELDPAALFKTALQETTPELLQVITAVFDPMNLSASEINLIMHLRELTGDRASSPIVFDGRGVIALVVA
jgi:hypothetical protein